MSMAVWVYRIPLTPQSAAAPISFDIPMGFDPAARSGDGDWVDAKPVHVALQHGQVAMWFEVDADPYPYSVTTRRFMLVGTGHDIPIGGRWCGTVLPNENLVLHVYEIR